MQQRIEVGMHTFLSRSAAIPTRPLNLYSDGRLDLECEGSAE